MNRLWVRLTLAFVLVAVIGIASIAALADLAIGRNFRDFVARNQVDLEDSGLTDQLVTYYEETNGWDGVDAHFAQLARFAPWLGVGRGSVSGQPGAERPRLELLLADADGHVVYHTDDRRRVDTPLSPGEREASVPLQSNGQTIGYLVITPGPIEALRPAERTFVDEVRRTLVLAGLIAIGVGAVLGLALSHNLARPLNRLATAARAIAAKDLTQRVEPSGSAEVADVANAFNEMAASLEQAETLRRNLVADVAHELRTPLSVLQGNLNALLDSVFPLDMSEVAKLYDETRLLSRLVDDLRELTQAESGQLTLNLRPTDLSPLLQSTTETFYSAAHDKQVRLTLDLASGLPRVQADPERIAQVLRNLLGNALRHTPDGGAITVGASEVDSGVEVSVSDTGEGIAEAELPYVFDRFWRGDKSRARETGGSGLGLAIARRLIEAHGGQIGVESTAGAGSRFWFKLPAI